ncbi:uncharacterized protein [Apostichopus japonicus]|uniref:uncharacterized protein n=1 Tax=Stichopus japonicus TaxID=307972 RepID=UPI003AB3972E
MKALTLIVCCFIDWDLIDANSNPYFHLYGTNCNQMGPGELECCDNPPIDPLKLEIDFVTLRLDDVTKPWQLDATITWVPLTTDFLEYAVRFQPVVTIDELNANETGFFTEPRIFCLEKDEILVDSCTDEPFFDTITNSTSLYVQDLLFGFPYKFEIQTIVNGSVQLKYFCFNSCFDVFPKTIAPDCFEETQDREFCKNYPVPINSVASNVEITTRCLEPGEFGWTVELTWEDPVNVNGEVSHYAILVRQFTSQMGPPYIGAYYNGNTTQLETVRNGTRSYTIRPFDGFGNILFSGQQYVLEIFTYVRLPERYNISSLRIGNIANRVLRTYESDWCPTTQKMTSPKVTEKMTSPKRTTPVDDPMTPPEMLKTDPTASSPPIPDPTIYIIISVVAAVIAVLMVCVFLYMYYRVCCSKDEKILDRKNTAYIPQKKRPNHYSFKEPKVPIEFKGKEITDLGNLEVEREPLDRGQYGEVYRGTLTGLKGKGEKVLVAIKTPKPGASLALKEDFLDEIKLMIEIGNHPHIMPVFGCCTLSEPYYLITEYMKYGALDKFLLRGRAKENSDIDQIYDITELNKVQIAWQISKGMSYLATTKYFHGDLAARNCLVGENLLVKVSDFGLSDDIYQRGYKRIAPEKKRPVKWYSPEANFDGVCSTKGDVWSFGIVLWEIYTLGGIPYAGMPAVEVVNRTKAGYRMPQPEGCPMDIYKVMAECWQESPQHRPNFSEIEYALEVILSHRAEISINRQQPSGNPDEAPYLPMVESDAPNMIRRDSSLADKINLYDVLGTSADSAFHDLSSTSADSFTTDYQLAGDGVRIEPIIEEEEGPRERRFSISSYQSNPDFVGDGSASSIVSEINSDESSGDSGFSTWL